MSSYIHAVNWDRKEHFSGHSLGGGAKSFEVGPSGFAVALVALMLGLWHGDQVTLERDPDIGPEEGWRELEGPELRYCVEREDTAR